MEDREIEHWLFVARRQMEQGLVEPAIESLRRALTVDPDFADAHAMLALCLVDRRRLHAAAHEATMALSLEPESRLALLASGQVAMARRRFRDAETAYREILDRYPEDVSGRRGLAEVYGLIGRAAEARPLLEAARELEPEDPDVHVDLGELALAGGDANAAEASVRRALELFPEHHGALILMGRIHLHRGDVEAARDHAVWALRQNPASRTALVLLAAIQARKSRLLGLWWRWSTWMGTLGDGRAILVLLAAYVLYRVGVVTAGAMDHKGLADLITFGWLALVVYTWIGPAIFRYRLKKELESVRLDRGF